MAMAVATRILKRSISRTEAAAMAMRRARRECGNQSLALGRAQELGVAKARNALDVGWKDDRRGHDGTRERPATNLIHADEEVTDGPAGFLLAKGRSGCRGAGHGRNKAGTGNREQGRGIRMARISTEFGFRSTAAEVIAGIDMSGNAWCDRWKLGTSEFPLRRRLRVHRAGTQRGG